MKLPFKILTVLSFDFLSACGMSPLSDEQKKEFFGTVGDTNRTVRSGYTSGQAKTNVQGLQDGFSQPAVFPFQIFALVRRLRLSISVSNSPRQHGALPANAAKDERCGMLNRV